MSKARTMEMFDRHDAQDICAIIERRARTEPCCFNGSVYYKRWKVTVEEIEEPQEVIHARLQKLWDENHNIYHYKPLRDAAAKHGLKP